MILKKCAHLCYYSIYRVKMKLCGPYWLAFPSQGFPEDFQNQYRIFDIMPLNRESVYARV